MFGVLAMIAGSLIDQPEFDLVSGREWSERAALADRAAAARSGLTSVATAGGNAAPAIANGWILLAGGLIVAVLVLAVETRRSVARSVA